MINLFSKGALLWIPSQTKRWASDGDQLKLFPSTMSITKVPMLGVFKTYTWSGDVEVLCPDGVWVISNSDAKLYLNKKSEVVC